MRLDVRRSGLANLIPVLSHKKAKCHSGEVAGRKRAWEVNVESRGAMALVVSLNNYESGSLTFRGVNLRSTGDRGVGLFISLGCP